MRVRKKIKRKGIKLAGKIKVWQTRFVSYISIINFVMLFYLYIIESPSNLKWYHWGLFISIIIIVLMFFDIYYIFPSSQEYSFAKNPEMVKLKKKLYKNGNKLDEILRRIK